MDLLEEYDYKHFLLNNTTSKKAMAGIDAWFTKVENFLTKKSYKLPDQLTRME